MDISTRNLDALPPPKELRKRCIALATLDEALSPDWEMRYYSFDPKWGKGELMASMKNGSGDDYFVGFCKAGVFVKGFDHESKMSPFQHGKPKVWPGMYDGVPEGLLHFRNEPAFKPDEVTYCAWRDRAAPGWKTGVTKFAPGADPDGSKGQLTILNGDPGNYQRFASEYYEIDILLEKIEAVYQHKKLTRDLILALNSDAEVEAVLTNAKASGYSHDWAGW